MATFGYDNRLGGILKLVNLQFNGIFLLNTKPTVLAEIAGSQPHSQIKITAIYFI